MIANLEHRVDQTLADFDRIGVRWGPEIRPNLSLHGLTHEQLHQLGGEQCVFTCPEYVVATTLPTPLGWTVSFFGDADLTCETCRRLARMGADHREALQLAGLDGSGM